MAKFFGLTFLVLTGLSIRTLADGNSSTTTHPNSVSTLINNAGADQTDTTNSSKSILPPSNTSASTNRSTPSPSPSPSLTPTQRATPSRCEYSGLKTNENNKSDEYEVTFTENNVNNQNYSLILRESSNHTIKVPLKKSTCRIPLKKLKPCHNYTVSFQPDCKLNGSNIISTRSWDETDIKPFPDWTNYSDPVYFQTKWNMTLCFKKNDSCSYISTEKVCNSVQHLNLPFSEEPEFSFSKNVNSSLTWKNRPKKCNGNVNFTCNSTGPFHKRAYKENKTITLAPYQNYSCTGMYPFLKDFIRSKSFEVFFECDLDTKKFELTQKSNNIEASWNLFSTNCNDRNFKFDVKCEPNVTGTEHRSDEKQCNFIHSKSCNVTNLNYDTNYTCTIMANYDQKKNIKNVIKVVEIQSGDPVIKNKTITLVNHNGYHVSYDVTWNGNQGNCTLHLKTNGKVIYSKTYKTTTDHCFFNVTDLYYLTTYHFELYAVNAKGKQNVKKYQHTSTTKYNSGAVLGFLIFLIILTSIALLLVLYKIFALRRKQTREICEMDHLLPPESLLHVEPIVADALVETYRKKIADEGRLFMDEFQSIPRIFSNYTVKEAKKSENQSKNRYVDILPYDYNRVSLSNGGKHDYINASFIEGYKEPNKYIAAQGPKEETVEDFWRMVWEQNSSIIVMVTRCEEGSKNKCAQYWPSLERETEVFDDFVVKIKREETCPDYIVRQLSLMNRKDKAVERDVTHIQFMSWPDHGVPGDPGLLLKLRRRVNSFKNIFSGPIVVHCSAGVGRTGTYIGIDAMIESLEAEGRVDIYGYVVKLRRQRCLMVQVEAQYVLIHTALIEYNQFGETEIALTDFHSVVSTLKQKEGNEPSLLELEYQKLPKFKNWRPSNLAVTEENKKKNRSSVVPYDFNRVLVKLEEEEGHNSEADDDEDYSSDEDDEECTKYINASYVDGYWCPRSLITAQGPLDNTVEDFLQMLLQKRAPVVVMLSDCMENDKEFCTQYWAEEKKEFGEMEVEVKETENTPTYIRRRLQIQSKKSKESLTTEQYHFLKWAGHNLPPNPLELVDMMKIIRQSAGHAKSRDSTSAPIVVHCNDGSSRSGIFCALWKLLDGVETEKLVDVFQVVKALRKERLGMLSTVEQYQFLYEALQAAFPVQNGEVSKKAASTDTVQVINEESCTTSADQEGATNGQSPENQPAASPENQAVEKPDTAVTSPAPEEGASESSCVSEKAPSEGTTNGPTVTV